MLVIGWKLQFAQPPCGVVKKYVHFIREKTDSEKVSTLCKVSEIIVSDRDRCRVIPEAPPSPRTFPSGQLIQNHLKYSAGGSDVRCQGPS